MEQPIRVLIAEDSPIFADLLQSLLVQDPRFTVISTASDGKQAVELTQRMRPDAVVMDVHMPVLSGIEAISTIMATRPTPVLVVTSDPEANQGSLHFDALRLGAVDVMAKPTSLAAVPDGWAIHFRDQLSLVASIRVWRRSMPRASRSTGSGQRTPTRVAARERAPRLDGTFNPARISERASRLPTGPQLRWPERRRSRTTSGISARIGLTASRVMGIVASTGGPKALAQLLEQLPRSFPAGILLVQHLSQGFTGSLVTWLNQVTPLSVVVAEAGSRIESGVVLVAPAGRHLLVNSDGIADLSDQPRVDGHCPSGTLMLRSVASYFGSRAVGVILSGMGEDGVAGLKAIKDEGGVTIAQNRASSVIYGMPRVAMDSGAAQQALAPDQIATVVCCLMGVEPACPTP